MVVANIVVTRDVAIIGGGTTGSFAATWLLDHGLSFAIVERSAVLGGHSQTVYDDDGHIIEYGNVFFEDTITARNYFGRYGVDFARLPAVNDPDHPIQFYNLVTGQHVVDFHPPAPAAWLTALIKWADILERDFDFLSEGYYLPDPVPEELLTPFVDFVSKHQLQDMLNVAFQVAQGFGDLLHVPTLYAAKVLSPSLVRKIIRNEMLVLQQGNAELYRRSMVDFSKHSHQASLFLSTRVVHVNREPDAEGYLSVLVETTDDASSSGYTATSTIRAKTLLVTIPPTKQNLIPFLELDETHEEPVFSRLFCNYYWTGVLRDAQLPAAEVQNCDLANPGAVPSMPGSYVFEATPSARLHSFWYGAPAGTPNQTREGVLDAVAGEISRLHAQMGLDGEDTKELQVVAFGDFGDFACMVDREAIHGAFYRDLYALQGYRATWWTGATWHTHDASLLWDFTAEVLRNMTAQMRPAAFDDIEVEL